jgi:hypothetical protein
VINLSSQLVNDATVQRFIRECPERFTDVIETAINKAAARIRYLVRRETPNQWGVTKEEMKDFRLKRALRRKGELTAMAIIRGSNVPLFKFQSVAPRTPMTGKSTGGVSVMLAGQSQNFQHAFISKMKSDHISIFERAGKDKKVIKENKKGKKVKWEPIKELTTVSVPGMTTAKRSDIPNKIAPMIQEEFENQFVREAGSWLSLLGAK